MKFLLFITVFIELIFAIEISFDKKDDIEKENYKLSVNRIVSKKLNELYNKYKYHSYVKDRNLIYYRPDKIIRKKDEKYIIWTRADVVSFENGKYFFIVPEGYKILYKVNKEFYIDYDPGKEVENLQIENYLQ